MALGSMVRRSIVAVSLSMAGALAGISQVSASTIVARLDVVPTITVDRTISNSSIDTSVTSVTTGQFTLTRTGGDFAGTLLPGIGQQFIAYCAEAQESIAAGTTYTFEVLDLSQGAENIGGLGVTRANYIRELVAGVQAQGGLGAVAAAAFQVAVWEIAREAPSLLPFSVTSGNTTFANASDPSVLTLAQSWLDTIINDGVQGPLASNVVALVNQENQDLMAFVRIPLPASAALFGLGLGGLLIGRRVRRR